MPTLRNEIFAYAEEVYHAKPEYLWADTPTDGVLRHYDNRKWFAVVMTVRRDRLKLPGEGVVDIINLKSDPALIGSLRMNPGILPGYHLNKEHWITALLDGTVPPAQLLALLDESYRLTARPAGKRV